MRHESIIGSPSGPEAAAPKPASVRTTTNHRAGGPTDFKLVGPEYVASCLTAPETCPGLVLLEAHFSSIDHPLDPDRPPRRHVPGAIQVHPSYLEAGANREKYYPFYDSPTDGNILPERDLIQALERLGIEPDSQVVIYGTEPDGTMAAARLAWGLIYAGVKTIRLLDGGIDAWTDHGQATSPTVKTVWDFVESPAPTLRGAARWSLRPEYLATTAEIRELIHHDARAKVRLVDVRRRGEWDGTLTDYYCFYSQAGHIPTAIHQGDWDNLLEPGTHKLEPQMEAVATRWRELGIIGPRSEASETTLIFYCGTGWRSSIAFLIAHLLGLPAKNYDDGFYGWSWEDSSEVTLGDSD